MKPKTILQTACESIPGFEEIYNRLKVRKTIEGCVPKTIEIYGRQLAKITLHFKQLPTELTVQQIEEYLYHVKINMPNDSYNAFQFTILTFNAVFKIEKKGAIDYPFPKLKRPQKLPVILSKEEVVRLINQPELLKHRMMIALLYGCGLRCSELLNIKTEDVDLMRRTIFVRQGKCKKDRYMPLGDSLTETLKLFIVTTRPNKLLFGSSKVYNYKKKFDDFLSRRSVLSAVKTAAEKINLKKNITVHTLRHCFATHLLEDGLDIVSVKELMGHSSIETTMIYLRIVNAPRRIKNSPFNSLEGVKVIRGFQFEFNFDPQPYTNSFTTLATICGRPNV